MTLTKVSGEAIKDVDFGSEDIATTGSVTVGTGSNSSPSIVFDSDPNTGIYSPGADQLALATNGTQRLLIEADGDINIDSGGVFYDATNNRLGVGTSAPNELLQVGSRTGAPNGKIEIAAENGSDPNDYQFLKFKQAGNTYGISLSTYRYVSGGRWYNDLRFNIGDSGIATVNPRMTINSSGNVGVGTSSPSRILQVKAPSSNSAHIALIDNDSDNEIWQVGNQADGDGFMSLRTDEGVTNVQFDATGNNWINGGNVGIGTTSPAEALHVVGDIVATGDITAFYSSDRRLKKDIELIPNAVDKVKQINGVSYAWNDEYLKDKELDGYFVREREVGVIAQEIEEVLPELVATRENGYKAVKYDRLVALLIEAVKEQQQQIDELKAKLEG